MLLLTRELADTRGYPTVVLKRLGDGAAEASAAARERLAEKMSAASIKRLARKLECACTALKSAKGATKRSSGFGRRTHWSIMELRLARRADRVRDAVTAAGTAYIPARLHEVRIAVKKLR
jgi:hypothetical protein